MFDIMGKMQEAQKQMEETKKQLSNVYVDAEAEGGLVKVTSDCNLKITNIEISEQLLKTDDKSELEDLVIVAVNKALEKAKATQEAEMAKVAQGMMPNLGGLGNLFGK
ncbi:MAG: YbaB/EbfC family nucleoid-associated protein [Bacteroidales bacterium]|nr:YbaB/EbfC family nucleoid-associated protein [Bacteroidales bacterium]